MQELPNHFIRQNSKRQLNSRLQVAVSSLLIAWDNTFAVLGAMRELACLHLIQTTLCDGVVLGYTGRLW